jgi:uncharacterized membrane protein YphA (DoxX/SURF4 family)
VECFGHQAHVFVVTVIIVVVLAAGIAVAGYQKVAGGPQQDSAAEHLGVEPGAWRLIGGAELLAALGLLIGLWLSWLGVVTAICLIVLTAGALIVHSRAGDGFKEMVNAIGFGALSLLALIFRLITI